MGVLAIGVVTVRADAEKDESDAVNAVQDHDDLPMLEGDQLERGTVRGEQEGVGALIYHTNIMNALGKPEEAYQSSLSVRGAASYLMGPHKLWRARLLPRQERTKLAVKQAMALFQPHDCQGCELKSCDFHPSSRRVYQRKVSSKLRYRETGFRCSD
ncbi:hypothetical protein KC19_8G026300 [Ceratodon purpureus]|uniref:Uncharacterized protein n=1 Tax=Ceratodon purpureus TaxID=3225 RepID=A0A8T0GWH4_CERPU|nr:hypothetical protein KC19_8G026300 [Ceratodon purpureus]